VDSDHLQLGKQGLLDANLPMSLVPVMKTGTILDVVLPFWILLAVCSEKDTKYPDGDFIKQAVECGLLRTRGDQ
jgi:hypothetical protein